MEKSYHGFCDVQMKNPREAFRAIPRAELLTRLERPCAVRFRLKYNAAMRFFSIPLAMMFTPYFQTPPVKSAVPPAVTLTQICLFQQSTGGVVTAACPASSTTPPPIGLPLTALDGNGTAIFQAGTAVVCPSAVPGPGAAGSQITCPGGLYLPLQLVSVGTNGLTVADNLSIGGSGDVEPFIAPNGNQPPHMAPGYTVAGGMWVQK